VRPIRILRSAAEQGTLGVRVGKVADASRPTLPTATRDAIALARRNHSQLASSSELGGAANRQSPASWVGTPVAESGCAEERSARLWQLPIAFQTDLDDSGLPLGLHRRLVCRFLRDSVCSFVSNAGSACALSSSLRQLSHGCRTTSGRASNRAAHRGAGRLATPRSPLSQQSG